MSESYRTTRVHIDSSALARLMEVARGANLYDNRREGCQEDNLEAVIRLLCDRFEATPEPLREDVTAKYGGGGE